MTISTRTPEGSPNRCPLCQRIVVVEPSLLCGDAPCPNCGTLLWFFNADSEPRLFDRRQTSTMRERILVWIAGKRGVSVADLLSDSIVIDRCEVDSLELVELVMELESTSN